MTALEATFDDALNLADGFKDLKTFIDSKFSGFDWKHSDNARRAAVMPGITVTPANRPDYITAPVTEPTAKQKPTRRISSLNFIWSGSVALVALAGVMLAPVTHRFHSMPAKPATSVKAEFKNAAKNVVTKIVPATIVQIPSTASTSVQPNALNKPVIVWGALPQAGLFVKLVDNKTAPTSVAAPVPTAKPVVATATIAPPPAINPAPPVAAVAAVEKTQQNPALKVDHKSQHAQAQAGWLKKHKAWAKKHPKQARMMIAHLSAIEAVNKEAGAHPVSIAGLKGFGYAPVLGMTDMKPELKLDSSISKSVVAGPGSGFFKRLGDAAKGLFGSTRATRNVVVKPYIGVVEKADFSTKDIVGRIEVSIAHRESGGLVPGSLSYDTVGPFITSGHNAGHRAYGYLMDMDFHITDEKGGCGDWAARAKMACITLDQFLQDRVYQKQLNDFIIGEMVNYYQDVKHIKSEAKITELVAKQWLGNGCDVVTHMCNGKYAAEAVKVSQKLFGTQMNTNENSKDHRVAHGVGKKQQIYAGRAHRRHVAKRKARSDLAMQ